MKNLINTRMRPIITFLSFIIGVSAFSQSYPYEWVLFGEHSEKIFYDIKQEYHIHIDQNGDFYPKQKIVDSDLRSRGENQLKIWAKEYPDDFEKIAREYNLNETSYSTQNFEILQDSIKLDIANSINFYSKSKPQTWLIHGYRKNLYQRENNIDNTSLSDNIKVKNRINKFLVEKSKNQPYYVEVYWDGKYMFFNKKSAIKLAKMFKKAIPNAQNSGYSLRDIFKKIDKENINIITHSTGTHVATDLLFNARENFSYSKPTPNQKINLILVASASSGKKLFDNFHKRDSKIDYTSKDNYKIINAYNKKDNVLRLNMLYPFRASTKLGCNYRNESGKLLKYFNKNFSNSEYIEVPITYRGGAPHYFHNYINNKGFEEVLKMIY